MHFLRDCDKYWQGFQDTFMLYGFILTGKKY